MITPSLHWAPGVFSGCIRSQLSASATNTIRGHAPSGSVLRENLGPSRFVPATTLSSLIQRSNLLIKSRAGVSVTRLAEVCLAAGVIFAGAANACATRRRQIFDISLGVNRLCIGICTGVMCNVHPRRRHRIFQCAEELPNDPFDASSCANTAVLIGFGACVYVPFGLLLVLRPLG
jgi:hypothetical protein